MAQGSSLQRKADRPLVLNWGDPHEPLPLQPLEETEPGSPEGAGALIPPWLATGPEGRPFDFCLHVRRLCDDITRRCDEFAHIRIGQVLFGTTKSRNRRSCGLQARLTPMRFAEGRLTRRHRHVEYQVQRFVVAEQEILYLMTFCVPRFLNQPFEDKLVTIFHEMFHIGPEFDGDLRRHKGRCSIHSHSRRQYDERMAQLARAYLAGGPDPDLNAFLRLNHRQLLDRHGSVIGVRIPRPKLIPLVDQAALCPAS